MPKCPKCAVEMTDEVRHGVILSTCELCKGNFLTRATFLASAVDERHAEALQRALEEVKPSASTDLECPTGDGGSLDCLSIRGVEIDRCPTCLGLYFDRGELYTLTKSESKPPKVEWKQSPRLTPKGVAAVVFLPDLLLDGILNLLP